MIDRRGGNQFDGRLHRLFLDGLDFDRPGRSVRPRACAYRFSNNRAISAKARRPQSPTISQEDAQFNGGIGSGNLEGKKHAENYTRARRTLRGLVKIVSI